MAVRHPSRRALMGGLAAAPFALAAPDAAAQSGGGGGPIRVGELNSYSRMAAFAVPYRNAMQMAVE